MPRESYPATISGDLSILGNLTVAGTTLLQSTTTISGVAKFADGSVSAPSIAFTTGASSGFYHTGTTAGDNENILVAITGVNKLTLNKTTLTVVTPAVAFTPTAATTGATSPFTLTMPTSTGQTASTEVNGLYLNMSATRTWATGNITTQREIRIAAPTYAFAGASTVTNAATVAISGNPTAGASATLTYPMALWVQTGQLAIGSPINSTAHLTVQENTSAVFRIGNSSTTHLYLTHGSNAASFGSFGGTSYITFDSFLNFRCSVDMLIGTTTPVTTSRLLVQANKTIASAAGATWDGTNFIADTVSITGNTAITTATGFNKFVLTAPTIAGDTATCAITAACTLYITGVPAAGANVTINRPYAIRADGYFAMGDTPVSLSNGVPIGAFFGNGLLSIRNATDACEIEIGSYGGNTYLGTVTAHRLRIVSNAASSTMTFFGTQTVASAAGAVLNAITIPAQTHTVTGATGITTATGFNHFAISAPTIAGDTATCTITNAATVYIGGAPTAGTNVAITNAYALWVDAGNVRFDGSTICGGAALATNATDGFLYVPTCAGTPTGVPTTQTGTAALVYDTTNHRLYIYDGSWT